MITSNLQAGRLTTWFESDRGRTLTVVSNTARAMVLVMDAPGDPGEHAVTPDAVGTEDGFVLENGQHDAYANSDTVLMAQALAHVAALIDTGRWHEGLPVQTNR